MTSFQKNIIERMGGSACYEMTVFRMAELIIEDTQLNKFYESIAIEDLCKMLKALLSVGLNEFNALEDLTTAHDSVLLMHYRLFEKGLDERHFGFFKASLQNALRQNLVEDDVMEDILECFQSTEESFFRAGAKRSGLGQGNTPLDSYDEATEEFILALKKDEPSSTTKAVRRRSSGSFAESAKKVVRRVSGENLLSMLRPTRTKRSKNTASTMMPSTVTAQ